jgi:hypothetical protein
VIASTEFSNRMSRPKVAKTCIIGSFCNGCSTRRCTTSPSRNISGATINTAK